MALSRHGLRRIADMTLEEKCKELLTSSRTGLPNMRSYEEDEALGWPFVGAMDIVGFGCLSDLCGHGPVNRILRDVGAEMAKFSTENVRIYDHNGGDIFSARGKDHAEMESVLWAIQNHLEETTFGVPGITGDGSYGEFIQYGIGMAYGIDTDYGRADRKSLEARQPSESDGLRRLKGTSLGGMDRINSKKGRPTSIKVVFPKKTPAEYAQQWREIRANKMIESSEERAVALAWQVVKEMLTSKPETPEEKAAEAGFKELQARAKANMRERFGE